MKWDGDKRYPYCAMDHLTSYPNIALLSLAFGTYFRFYQVLSPLDFRISDLAKNLMELIFRGAFRLTPEGPVRQIHSPHLNIGAPGILSDLLTSVQMLKIKWYAESNGKLPHLFIPGSWICSRRPAFGQNCNHGSCVCSERPTLEQNTLMMIKPPRWSRSRTRGFSPWFRWG